MVKSFCYLQMLLSQLLESCTYIYSKTTISDIFTVRVRTYTVDLINKLVQKLFTNTRSSKQIARTLSLNDNFTTRIEWDTKAFDPKRSDRRDITIYSIHISRSKCRLRMIVLYSVTLSSIVHLNVWFIMSYVLLSVINVFRAKYRTYFETPRML